MSIIVTKTDRVVFQQLALNKLLIPDVLIDIIKDFLFIDKEHVKQNKFQSLLKNILSRIEIDVDPHSINGEYRWVKSTIRQNVEGEYEDNNIWYKILAEPTICYTCGTLSNHHGNLSGICLQPGENDAYMAHYISHIHPFEHFINNM